MYLSIALGIFSSLWGVSVGLHWSIHIQTADQDDAGTNSEVLIKVFGDNGEISSVITPLHKPSSLFLVL